MKITLQKGETIEVCFADSDGQIDVKFGKNKITVKTDLPDTEGRVGTIYEEKFGTPFFSGEVVKPLDTDLRPAREEWHRSNY